MIDVDRLSKRYIVQSAAIIVVISVVILVARTLFGWDNIIVPLCISAAFSFVVDCTDALMWRLVASKSRESLTTFYTAVSGFRMLLSLAVMLIYYLVAEEGSIRTFFFVFATFYILLLAHNSFFFAGVSNSIDKLNDVK